MIAKLAERLARLEAAQVATASSPMPLELVQANLYAVAIALGGYPRAPEPAPSYRQDSISDGFARGLGYLNRDDMEAQLETDPDQWEERLRRAEAVLAAKYVTAPDGEGMGRSPTFQMMVGVLDEIMRAKAARLPGEPHHWPSDHPRFDRAEASIRRSLTFFGMTEGASV